MSVGTNTSVGFSTIGGGGYYDPSMFASAANDLTLESFGLNNVGRNNSLSILAQPAARTESATVGGVVPNSYVPTTRATIGTNGQLIIGGGGGTVATPTAGSQVAAGAAAAAGAPSMSRLQELQLQDSKPIVEWRVMVWNEGLSIQDIANAANSTVEEVMRWNPNAKVGDEILMAIHGDGPVSGGGPTTVSIPDWVQVRLAQNGVTGGATGGGTTTGGGATQQTSGEAGPPASGGVQPPAGTDVPPSSGPVDTGTQSAPVDQTAGQFSLPQLQTLLATLTQFRDSVQPS